MFKRLLTIVIAGMLLVATGCGDSHEAVADDMISAMEKASEIIGDIDDEDSLNAAVKELDAVADEVAAIVARAKELGEPDEATKKKIQEKLQAKSKELEKTMESENEYFKKNPMAGMALLAPMMKIGQSLQGAKWLDTN